MSGPMRVSVGIYTIKRGIKLQQIWGHEWCMIHNKLCWIVYSSDKNWEDLSANFRAGFLYLIPLQGLT